MPLMPSTDTHNDRPHTEIVELLVAGLATVVQNQLDHVEDEEFVVPTAPDDHLLLTQAQRHEVLLVQPP